MFCSQDSTTHFYKLHFNRLSIDYQSGKSLSWESNLCTYKITYGDKVSQSETERKLQLHDRKFEVILPIDQECEVEFFYIHRCDGISE